MDALDEIEATVPALRRYAHALIQDREAAERLVQDCVTRALARREEGRGKGSMKAWMFCILMNRYRQQLRRGGPQLAIVREPLAATPGAAEDHLVLPEVHAAIGRLPPDQRAVLLLVALEGISIEEAARLLCLPRATALNRLARARRALCNLTGREDRPRRLA